MPQINLLKALTVTDGQSLKDLSRQLRLGQSTVSGIVDRLEVRGLVQRRVPTGDRRFVQIFLSDAVKDYLQHELPMQRLSPLSAALNHAQPEERAQILTGLALLRRLIEAREMPQERET